jgi:hypothetical protein
MHEGMVVDIPNSTIERAGALLDLSGDRQVTFKDKGQIFVFTFNRITDAQWRHYFSGLVVENEKSGSGRLARVDYRTAGIDLFETAVKDVAGYKLREGKFTDIPNWKTRVPYGHKQKAVDLLTDVTFSDSAPEFFDPEVEEIFVDAKWGADQGMMTQFRGLAHRFTPPSGAHQQRFNRAAGESRVVGGRSGKTISTSRQDLLADLYDELIVSVEGYAFAGKPLEGTEQIRREMDTFHKAAAVNLLFSSPEDDQ